jgi:hypothetical protein
MTSRALFGGVADVDAEFAAKLKLKDPKTAVNQFCQRFTRGSITKDDVVFTVTKYPTGYQATVKLNCIDGQEFAGEVAPTQRDAEHNAANQVLNFYNDEIEGMKAKEKKKKKKRPAAPGPSDLPVFAEPKLGPAPAPEVNSAMTFKSDLNAHVGKILRRVLDKDEVMYTTQQVVGGYQSTVRMPGMPGDWGQQIWAGEVSVKRQNAEQSVAKLALAAIQADKVLMDRYNEPPKERWNPLIAAKSRCRDRAAGKGTGPPGNVFGGMAYWKEGEKPDDRFR